MATFFLITIYITFISLGLPDSLLGASWPLMRLDFGMPLDSAGIATIIISGGTIISSLFSEKLIRRFGTGKVTAVSVLATAVALFGISFSSSFWFILLLGVPLGLGAGAVDAALNNYVALHYKAYHMSWLHCFWGVGAFCGPLIIAGFIENQNWRGGYLTVSILQLAVSALLFVTLPLWKRQGITPGSDVLPKGSADEAQAPPAGNAFKIPGVPFALLTFLFYCAIEYTVGLWGSSYLAEGRGFTQAAAARGVSLFYIGITVGRALNGFLTIKFKNRTLVRVGIVVVLAGALLFLLPLPPSVSLAALCIMGLGCAPVYPSLIHETPRSFGAANSQKVVGLQMAFAYIGSTFMPPIVGLVARRTTITSIPIFPLVFAAGMLLCSETLNRIVQKQKTTGGPG